MNALFEEFSSSNAAAWKERLVKDLKGIGFEDLSVQDRNGNTIHPFYTSEDKTDIQQSIFSHKDWVICTQIKVDNEAAANQQALQELAHGATGLCFILKQSVDLAALLAQIEIEHIHTRFTLSSEALGFYADWQQYLHSQNKQSLSTTIIFDPIAQAVQSNSTISESKSTWLQHTTDCIAIDARIFQNAGANSAYQLACTLAQLNEYLFWLQENEQLNAIQKVDISLAVGTDFFEEIAKCRALQLCTNNLLAAYQLNAQVQLHIETSDIYRSPFDAYSNLLRDTIAGMAAVLGGCNSLFIHPFDQSKQGGSALSQRMSRNQQLIFKEEAYLNQIADAASGSFYLETLSEQIAEQAWSMFQAIEEKGGIIADQQNIQATITAQAAELIQAYKEGKRVLIGVNKYIDPKDAPSPVPEAQQASAGISPIYLTQAIVS